MGKKFLVPEPDAQTQVRIIAADLEAIRFRLLGVRASLEAPAEEPGMLAGERDMDVSTTVRAVVECVVNDSIDAAIRDLRTAADYVPGGGPKPA